MTVPAAGRGDRVHHLHRLDDQQRVAGLDLAADADERRGAGLGGEIDGADHRRFDRIGVAAGAAGAAAAAGKRQRRCRSGGAAAAAAAAAGGGSCARDLDLAVAVFDLDFGEPGFGQQFGQFADQFAVDVHAAAVRLALLVSLMRSSLHIMANAYARRAREQGKGVKARAAPLRSGERNRSYPAQAR